MNLIYYLLKQTKLQYNKGVKIKFETPENAVKKEKNEDIEHFNTIFRYIESGEESNNLRIESFQKLSPNMKEALLLIGKTFKEAGTVYPWAIHGSTALVLEGETSKQPVDIDLAFGKPDFEKVFAALKNFEDEGHIRGLETEEMKNFEDEENGCIKIFAEIKTGENPEVWVEFEAFAQNIDPEKPRNGITNPGLEKTGINIYNEKSGDRNIEINFDDRGENFNFYLQVAYIELQKYEMDNRFMHVVKNKFPQRLNNLISIIKREEREEFEKKLKKGEVTENQKPNIENITDDHINMMIEKFVEFNTKNENLKLADFAHSKIAPVEVMQKRFNEFKEKRDLKINIENKGFIHQKIELNENEGKYTRENAVDELTLENLEDMEEIAEKHRELIELHDKCENLKKCNSDEGQEIYEKAEGLLLSIAQMKENYMGYLKMINYNDNRDFIAYVSIKEILENYIIPSLELAVVSLNKTELILEEAYA